jgi:hypothetical protein
MGIGSMIGTTYLLHWILADADVRFRCTYINTFSALLPIATVNQWITVQRSSSPTIGWRPGTRTTSRQSCQRGVLVCEVLHFDGDLVVDGAGTYLGTPI